LHRGQARISSKFSSIVILTRISDRPRPAYRGYVRAARGANMLVFLEWLFGPVRLDKIHFELPELEPLLRAQDYRRKKPA